MKNQPFSPASKGRSTSLITIRGVEVESYFTALFQGRHVASNLEAGPIDSGTTFQPDERLFPGILEGLPQLSPEDSTSLNQPLTLGKLEAAV